MDAASGFINHDLESIVNFSKLHSLNLNINKTSVVLFGRKIDIDSVSDVLSIQVNDIPLRICKSAKILGVVVDSDLRFKDHVSSCIRRALSSLRALYYQRECLSITARKMLSDALILSHFNYCDIVYGPCLDSNTALRIQRIQNSCIRFIYGIKKYSHVSHKLPELKWLKMSDRRLLHLQCFYHKVITSKIPPYLYLRLTFRSDVHNINIRFPHYLTPPCHRTALYERSFTYNIARLYNDLPAHLKTLSYHRFRLCLRGMILSSAL